MGVESRSLKRSCNCRGGRCQPCGDLGKRLWAEGAAGAHEQLGLAAIETPDLDHQGGGSHLERFNDSAVESDLSFEK